MKSTTVPTELTVIHYEDDGAPFLYSDRATRIRIEDEGAGPYIQVLQEGRGISIDAEEWPAIKAGIERMLMELLALELHDA